MTPTRTTIPVRAADVQVGVYVRPRLLVAGDSLYEVEEVTPGGRVLLRDCMIPVCMCAGGYGALETTRLQMAKDFELVVPEPDLAALVAA
jgi:hypothetical protein